MPTFDYRCDKCGFTEEYNNSKHLPKDMQPPKDLKCPNIIKKTDKNGKVRNYKCKGVLERLFSAQNQSFDIIGFCYANTQGKKAWKTNLSKSEQAAVLTGDRNPY